MSRRRFRHQSPIPGEPLVETESPRAERGDLEQAARHHHALALFSIATAVSFHSNFADQNQMINFLKKRKWRVCQNRSWRTEGRSTDGLRMEDSG
jgi:hypothetical protein